MLIPQGQWTALQAEMSSKSKLGELETNQTSKTRSKCLCEGLKR